MEIQINIATECSKSMGNATNSNSTVVELQSKKIHDKNDEKSSHVKKTP